MKKLLNLLKEKINLEKRPIAITLISVLGIIYSIFIIYFLYYVSSLKLETFNMIYLFLIFYLLWLFICMIGLWKMKSWAVYIYIGGTIAWHFLNGFINDKYEFSFYILFIQAIIISILLKYLKKMD